MKRIYVQSYKSVAVALKFMQPVQLIHLTTRHSIGLEIIIIIRNKISLLEILRLIVHHNLNTVPHSLM